jgi:hypothetical protein
LNISYFYYFSFAFAMQSLKSNAFDNFTAIYYLLLERWRHCARIFTQVDYRLGEDHRRPSTIAEQTLVRSGFFNNRAPALVEAHAGPFSRTTDGVTPLEIGVPPRMTQQQRIYTMGARGIGIAAASIDEGVEADSCSEGDYEIGNQHSTSGLPTCSVPSFQSTDSSSLASFDSNIEVDAVSSPTPSVASSEVSSSAVAMPCFPITPVILLDHSAAEETDSGNQSEVGAPCVCGLPGGAGTLQLPTADSNSPANATGSNVDHRDMCFHSGRRASDGLVSRADVFPLQESMKTRGVAELRKELEMLQLQTSSADTPGAHRKMQLLSVMGRAVQPRSFDESTSSASPGRQNLSNVCKGRPILCTNSFRPRLAMFHRARIQAEACPLLSRSRLHPEHYVLQQRFQGLNISGDSSWRGLGLNSSSHVVSTSAFQRPFPGGQQTIAGCLSDQRLATASPPTGLDVSSCRSQDSLHCTRASQESPSPLRSPCISTPSSFLDATSSIVSGIGANGGGATGDSPNEAVRRHIVRRTLYRLVHQQTLISPCGEEDDASGAYANVGFVGDDLSTAALPPDAADESNSRHMDVT